MTWGHAMDSAMPRDDPKPCARNTGPASPVCILAGAAISAVGSRICESPNSGQSAPKCRVPIAPFCRQLRGSPRYELGCLSRAAPPPNLGTPNFALHRPSSSQISILPLAQRSCHGLIGRRPEPAEVVHLLRGRGCGFDRTQGCSHAGVSSDGGNPRSKERAAGATRRQDRGPSNFAAS